MYLKFGHIQPVPKLKEDPDAMITRETITAEHEAFVASFVREFMPGVATYLPDVTKGRATFTKMYLESFSRDFMPIIGQRHAGQQFSDRHGRVSAGSGRSSRSRPGRCAALYALDKPESVPESQRLLFSPDRKQVEAQGPGGLVDQWQSRCARTGWDRAISTVPRYGFAG